MNEMNPQAILKSLHKLVGKWSGLNEDGHPAYIDYALTANDTALIEEWTFHTHHTALTIYHMDGPTLMATHYCPIGNQPRLDLKRQRTDGTLEFECVSATHLNSFKDPHEHSFDLRINDDGSLYRTETYMEDSGVYSSNGILFKRIV